MVPESNGTETSPLLRDPEAGNRESTKSGWRLEFSIISNYTAPLMVALLLQHALTGSSIFMVGHLGKKEIGAVSLANLTAQITGYFVFQGLATCLDTLCPQAYGSGKPTMVGLHVQRLTLFMLLLIIPIGAIWFNADRIFLFILPDESRETAILAGVYLRIAILGAPGYACFESGKRFFQAQGMFGASLVVLLVCSALNIFMGWLFVWVGYAISKYPEKLLTLVLFTETAMGICRCTYRRRDCKQSSSSIAGTLCHFCQWIGVLAPYLNGGLARLESDVAPRHPKLVND